MRICVLGLWHLGSVTAACCARHFQVTGLDAGPQAVAGLREGRAPLFEPGLNELLHEGLASGRLRFTSDPSEACSGADVLWLCIDTPVNERDESDVDFVLDGLRRCLAHLPPKALVVVSSQLPVGTCRALEAEFPQFSFACSPENLRLGRALETFAKAERVVVGVRDESRRPLLEELFAPFTAQVQFMRTESAEMVKHALNSFLALSITFINEIARLSEHLGADAREVAAGLKSESRIGPRAYLGPGGPFAGGTLARDVVSLTRLAAAHHEPLALIPAIRQSNELHRQWALQKLKRHLGDLKGRTIAVLGLVYTPNTDTLRRSAAVELCRVLVAAGARVQAFDPGVRTLAEPAGVLLAGELSEALRGADAAVVCTEWPQFRQAPWNELVGPMRRALVVDPNGFLQNELNSIPGVEHLSVGQASI
ncbi:MAG TPA: nucleotide sugar dehydrogenase [Candidatus Saccharimonadales bacterium]|nr:nucleotide sugar dehydrogenase [Candidatus Saccharimonadales bacterium]